MLRATLCVLAAVTTVALAAQQQPPVFRSRLETVAVPTTVFDEASELVTALTKDDFKVFDEGHWQVITNFISGLQPISAVVLLDTSASMTTALDRARLAAEQFIIRLRPGDQARVGTFNDLIKLTPDFTGDRDALLRALRQNQRFANPTRLFDAIEEAMTSLAPLGGRRVVLALTDGCDTGSRTPWDTLRRRFMSEELMIYIVRFRPRMRMAPRQRGRGGTDCDVHADLELPVGTSLKDFFNINDPRRVLMSGQIVDRMASETGGGNIFLRDDDDVGATFTRISNELHHLYLLGFAPEKRDGKTHELVVRVKDPTMLVRARRSYLAPLESPAEKR